MINRPWIHVLIYHLIWISTLTGWVKDIVWLGPLVALSYIVIVGIARKNKSDFKWIALASLLGWCIETGHQSMGIISYHQTVFAPWWLVPLWGSFSLCCGLGLVWIKKTWVASILGAAGGPLTYMAACGAASQHLGEIQILILAIEWAILFPVCCVFFQKVYSGRNSLR